MVAERRIIDIDEMESLAEVLRAVERMHAPIELRKAGKVVAIVSPPEVEGEETPAPGSAEALLKFAGAFRDVFTDAVVDKLEAQRGIPSRVYDWE
jgi:hypothetical protein